MDSYRDRPFDHNTVQLDAVFVPDAAQDAATQRRQASEQWGYHGLELPAVFVPDDTGDAPGYPYVKLGIARLAGAAAEPTPDAPPGTPDSAASPSPLPPVARATASPVSSVVQALRGAQAAAAALSTASSKARSAPPRSADGAP